MIERSIQAIANPCVWTEHMLNALSNGVKRGKWYSLYDKVFNLKNIFASYEKVHKNKGKHGVDNVSLENYSKNLTHNLNTLHGELKLDEYQPLGIRRVYIPKAGTNELRPLGIPTVRDRIAQRALLNVIEPIFDIEFSNRSFGFRKGLGCKDALRTVMTELRAGKLFIVDADIKSYFDEIDHEILMDLIKEKISDGRILDLIRKFLKQGVLEELQSHEVESGTPQGGIISPLLANIFLDPLDKLLESYGMSLVRYADDFLIMCKSQEDADSALELVQKWTRKVKLRLHPQKTRVVDMATNGSCFEFLGYHFERTKRGRLSRWPRPSSMKKIRQTIKHITRRRNRHSLEVIYAQLHSHCKGWFQYFKHSSKYTFDGIDKYTRRRLRRLILQRHRKSGHGKSINVQKKYTNAWFKSGGYIALYNMYEAEIRSLRSNH